MEFAGEYTKPVIDPFLGSRQLSDCSDLVLQQSNLLSILGLRPRLDPDFAS